ncbi:hypothetical protein TNCV_3613131 [Trichonephila clavipes]|uniref:DUF4371 domain-containing protein n=1 Tax=Trichonephila clavipes TaxID=2585209 RepID=A0A8X6VNA0_TRICX|nr:hypothetical protein TNCV_3613131 [Trichonephila clavipes]
MSNTNKKIKSVSRNTVASRVDEIADNLSDHSTISTFQAYSIAIDESTDIRNIGQFVDAFFKELLGVSPMHMIFVMH